MKPYCKVFANCQKHYIIFLLF